MTKYKSGILREQDYIVDANIYWIGNFRINNAIVKHIPTNIKISVLSHIGQLSAYNEAVKRIEHIIINRPKYVLFKHQEINTKYLDVDFLKMACRIKGVEYEIEEYGFEFGRYKYRVII